jgi:protein phosphatase
MKCLQAAGLSDVGRKRSLNEDSFCVDEALGLLLVADGMGGHAAGEVASREAVSIVYEFLRQPDSHFEAETLDATEEISLHSLQDDDRTWEDLPNPMIAMVEAAVQQAGRQLYALNREKGCADGQGMGTTLVGLWKQSNLEEVVVFHVGDSRLYLYRNGQLSSLTKDHTLHQQWLDQGLPKPLPPHNIVLRALGPLPYVAVDTSILTLQDGDLFMLCSDGLTGMVSNTAIEEVLRPLAEDSLPLESACTRLIDMANGEGGNDNITVILARYLCRI